MRTSIIIPNWNGRKLLEKNLPKVIAAAGDAEVIVVDDASPDDSNEFLKENYSGIKIIKHKTNLGFATSCNDGIRESVGEIVVLLNLDVVPEKDFLKYSLPHFNDPNVFAVSFHEPAFSWARIYWKNGFVEHEPGPKADEVHISAWASGGSAAFRRSMWKKLGGFDELYKPFYWEDVDIGYRAWKRGYKILWEPKAIVHHKHESTIGKHFAKEYINLVSDRNRLLFIWKNLIDKKMTREHQINLFKKLIFSPKVWLAFLAATRRLPMVLDKRKMEFREQQLSDQEVFLNFELKKDGK